jgi:hypothetical protein
MRQLDEGRLRQRAFKPNKTERQPRPKQWVPACPRLAENRRWLSALQCGWLRLETLSQHQRYSMVCIWDKDRVGDISCRSRWMAETSTTCGAELVDMREVPLCMAFDTGIPGAPMSAAAASALRLLEGSSAEHRVAKKGMITCLTYKPNGCEGRCFFQAIECAPLLKSAQE